MVIFALAGPQSGGLTRGLWSAKSDQGLISLPKTSSEITPGHRSGGEEVAVVIKSISDPLHTGQAIGRVIEVGGAGPQRGGVDGVLGLGLAPNSPGWASYCIIRLPSFIAIISVSLSKYDEFSGIVMIYDQKLIRGSYLVINGGRGHF
jgi:hypothetical protein